VLETIFTTIQKKFKDSLLSTVLRYRVIILTLVKRDIKARYRDSFLGFFWNILNPLIFMVVYTVVFSYYFKVGTEGYPVFLLSGFLPWLWIMEAITTGTSSIVSGGPYIQTSSIPSELLPVISVCSSFMNFLFSLPLLFIFAAIFKWTIGWSILLLPIILINQALFLLGIVLLTSSYNVFFRDLGYLIGHILTSIFFLTPIFYTIETVPVAIRPYYDYYPIALQMKHFHAVFYHGTTPDWTELLILFLLGIVLSWLGLKVFKRHKDSFMEYL
jgi:lipopolysaccharide transport system permease protein